MAIAFPRTITDARVFIKQYVAVLCFAFLAFVCLIAALKFTAASFDYYQVRNILASWQEQGNEQTKGEYQLAKTAIESAIDSQPSHALYQDLLGQVYEWGALAGYEDKEQALSTAKAHYLKATQLRPLWPVTWASLAMIKWRQQEFDDEMLTYLQHANALGPKKPEVHLLYVQLGMALYASNHPMLLSIRETFYQRISLGLRAPQSRAKVLALIKQYQADKRVCRWLRNEPMSLQRMIPHCANRNKSS
ncbi:MAG: VpsP family polysaccharide biosynthesis protein [Paraglaciecola polaris]|uniref:VpsP family polysaccharide biosynthesis protein n=1 Tax=Paraglaciecola polaris TaxID=222814 RepID=UPI0030037DD1